jgi:hypothetical protein
MAGARVPVLLTVLSGSFQTQPLAFAALKDAADDFGLDFDLADVDVIREAADVRLAHYFRPQIVARIQAMQAGDDTAVILRPSALTANPRFPPEHSPLRLLGKFAGSLIEPSELRL